MIPYYHYASATIDKLVMASKPNRVPNFDKMGAPRRGYFTDSLYVSAATASTALMIGPKHPGGPRAAPEYRFDLDVSLCTYSKVGVVPGGTATEYITAGSPEVTASTSLGP